MTAETPEKLIFTAIRCKSADRHFTIILGIRASYGSISRLLFSDDYEDDDYDDEDSTTYENIPSAPAEEKE